MWIRGTKKEIKGTLKFDHGEKGGAGTVHKGVWKSIKSSLRAKNINW